MTVDVVCEVGVIVAVFSVALRSVFDAVIVTVAVPPPDTIAEPDAVAAIVPALAVSVAVRSSEPKLLELISVEP